MESGNLAFVLVCPVPVSGWPGKRLRGRGRASQRPGVTAGIWRLAVAQVFSNSSSRLPTGLSEAAGHLSPAVSARIRASAGHFPHRRACPLLPTRQPMKISLSYSTFTLLDLAVVFAVSAFATDAVVFADEVTLESPVSNVLSKSTLTLELAVSSQATAGGLQLDVPVLVGETSALIAEIRGLKGEGEFGVFSGGVFFRQWFERAGVTAGAGVFYDALQDTDGYSYSQIGVSGEISRGLFTLRANGYIPVGGRTDRSHSEIPATVDGVSGFWEQIYTRDAASGWDVELEAAIPRTPRWIQPSVAVGYYRWQATNNDFSGVSARASARLWRRVTADIEWRSDARGLGQEWRAGFRVQIPLGRRESLASVAAGPDGKSVFEPAYDGKSVVEPHSDGKTMRPLAGGKNVVPMEPAASHPGLPPDFFRPMRRAAWPNVSRSVGRTFDPPAAAAVDPVGCGCATGGVIVID
jgi:hypothetical protein